MELNKIKELKDVKTITSTESICYVYKDIIYKVYKNNLTVRDRLDTIEFFLENNIQHTPKLYDLIYDDSEIVGYSMQYYKKAIPISGISRFKLLKEKCLELIEVYQSLKDDNNLCYIDFHKDNIFVNNNSVLFLDIDCCLKRNFENEQASKQLLKEFIIRLIYKTYLFEIEPYFTSEERKQIRNILFKNTDGENINSIEDLKKFLNDISKKEIKKVLKKIPYKIK
ncbi:MAG: hypothetical protein IJZ46_01970 [Bacilli bacterium]|nr:hypothetical protein [Bacilli bacterium]